MNFGCNRKFLVAIIWTSRNLKPLVVNQNGSFIDFVTVNRNELSWTRCNGYLLLIMFTTITPSFYDLPIKLQIPSS